jgi:hypothetical protein
VYLAALKKVLVELTSTDDQESKREMATVSDAQRSEVSPKNQSSLFGAERMFK